MDSVDVELIKRLRPLARKKAEEFSDALSEGLAQDRNIHQLSLDLQDEVQAYLLSLPEEDRETFEALYIEELNAQTAMANQSATEKLAQAEAIEAEGAKSQQVMSGIIVLIAILVLVFFLAR
ncbi:MULTISPECIES: hypothetical protein [Alcaligenes]|uniref:Uncharacterized protein n=1 Tax=Alcaligenes faecalis TaxID=511 RepID=A0AB33CTN2_ALCFA|nr:MULTISPECIES: hypothetical protein [Alcaligenes]ASR89559.1 hypothetical protein AFA_08950 [Alcaligenes faecalis]MBY6309803.1 hypothetical protein [Alcaligenes faecalis]MBY6316073.1 hypothetical protein [Alcaligenes faecalis]MBY6390720.1 hypothetical protein [Alcaligenes faecalis]MCC9162726.1 hypothetical protein [Alcaligenes sp. MMA]